jgi:DNA adenine methylase
MLYLNRTCWNGLYRVNRDGVFNVPRGTKDAVILSTDDFDRYSLMLKGRDISTRDFEEAIDEAGSGDLIFADPPYTVAHNNNGFIKYNDRIFSWSDQIRLRDALCRAVSRGANAIVTNAAHSSVVDLYKDCGQIHHLTRASVLAASPQHRSSAAELLITMGYSPITRQEC